MLSEHHKEKMNDKFEFEVTKKFSITNEDIEDIIIGAFEGGINYWCYSAEPKNGWNKENEDKDLYDLLFEGETIILEDRESDDTWELTWDKVKEGIKKYFTEYDDTDVDSMDGNSYDCIIQFALFDKVIFGW